MDVDATDSIIQKIDKITGSDVKKCTPGVEKCGLNAACTNTVNGSFTCACKSGYFRPGTTCMDKDECKLGLHNCDANADCTNTDGSFTCACKSGYFGNGINCLFFRHIYAQVYMQMYAHVCSYTSVHAFACCKLFSGTTTERAIAATAKLSAVITETRMICVC